MIVAESLRAASVVERNEVAILKANVEDFISLFVPNI
jgi:hypothetical protein